MIHYYYAGSVFCVYPDHVWAHVPGADAGDISALSQLSLRGSASDGGMSPDVTCTSCVWGPSHNSDVAICYNNPQGNYRNIVLNKGLSVPLPLQQK